MLDSFVEEVRELKNAGLSIKAIRDQMRVAAPKIREALVRAGLTSEQARSRVWQSGQVEQLKGFIALGWNTKQIAEAMSLTPNAIKRKAQKLGLSLAVKHEPKDPKAPRKAKVKIAEAEIIPIGPLNDFPEDKGCRWIIGDVVAGEWQCCGHPSAKDRSYCEHHLGRSLEKPREGTSHLVRKTIPTVWLRGLAA